MKIRVIKDFTDRETRKVCRAGNDGDSELDVTDERGQELISKGFAEAIGEYNTSSFQTKNRRNRNEQNEVNDENYN